MKNHVRVGGKLLQTNKKFSHLKLTQKEWIANRFRELYQNKMKELGIEAKLNPENRDAVINALYMEVKEREIWIPYDELEKYCYSRIANTVNRMKTS